MVVILADSFCDVTTLDFKMTALKNPATSSGYSFVILRNQIVIQINVLEVNQDFHLMKGIITILQPQQVLVMHFAYSTFTISSQGTSKYLCTQFNLCHNSKIGSKTIQMR